MKVLKDKFHLKYIGLVRNNILETDILGLDLYCNKKSSIVTLKVKSYIERIMGDYQEKNSAKTKVKKDVRWLQILVGKLVFIKTYESFIS